jgi:hypothetical protein
MAATTRSVKQIEQLFSRHKSWMIKPLAEASNYAVISVRRFLHKTGYFRSYTHNGKWYTLASIPEFNRHGIWVCDEVAFSKHGNMIQTIAHLLDKSSKGLSARELSDILHHPCQAVLAHLSKAQRIERVRGAHAYIYLSSDASIRRRQLKALPVVEHTVPCLTAEVAIFVLVDYIHHPSRSLKELAHELNKNHGIVVSSEAIGSFFAQHSLKKRPTSER